MLGTGLPGSSSGTCHVLWLGYSQPCSLLGSPVLLMRGTGFGVSTAPLCTKSTYGGGGRGAEPGQQLVIGWPVTGTCPSTIVSLVYCSGPSVT